MILRWIFYILLDFFNEITSGVILIDDYVALGKEGRFDYSAAVRGMDLASVVFDLEEVNERRAYVELGSDLIDD